MATTKHPGLIVILALSLSGCYYDKADVVYPPNAPCDTATIGFAAQIKPILDAKCASCHGASYAAYGGGVDLQSYQSILNSVNNGTLLNSVLQNGKASPMPKGGNKVDDCSIKKISIWIRNGSPNN